MTQIATITIVSGPPSAEISLTRGTTVPATIVNPPTVTLALTRQVGDGPTGPRGFGGSGSSNFEWTQNAPQTVWVINHGLNSHPSVTVVDLSGQIMLADYRYLSLDLVEVSFTFPTTGKVYFN